MMTPRWTPVLAIETLRSLERKGRAGEALTLVAMIPTALVVVIAFCAVVGGVGMAALGWLLGGVVAASALGVIEMRNIRRRAARKAALSALDRSRATASLTNAVLEVHANDDAGTWRFSLDGSSSRSMLALPMARVHREDG